LLPRHATLRPGLAVSPCRCPRGSERRPAMNRSTGGVATARRGGAEPFGEPTQNRLDLSVLGLGLGGYRTTSADWLPCHRWPMMSARSAAGTRGDLVGLRGLRASGAVPGLSPAACRPRGTRTHNPADSTRELEGDDGAFHLRLHRLLSGPYRHERMMSTTLRATNHATLARPGWSRSLPRFSGHLF
jgi:hypothetical protein